MATYVEGRRAARAESRASRCGASGQGAQTRARIFAFLKGIGLLMRAMIGLRLRPPRISWRAACVPGHDPGPIPSLGPAADVDQAEWRQSYETSVESRSDARRSPTCRRRRSMRPDGDRSYQASLAQGRMELVPAARLRVGSRSPAVEALRERLSPRATSTRWRGGAGVRLRLSTPRSTASRPPRPQPDGRRRRCDTSRS